MPNRENIQKWVDALRSGEYAQGEGVLRSYNDKFCCLGVACEVARKEGVPIRLRTSAGDPAHYGFEDTTLPDVVVRWLDVDDPNPMIDGRVNAISANDTLNLTFAEIADRLEAYYLAPQ